MSVPPPPPGSDIPPQTPLGAQAPLGATPGYGTTAVTQDDKTMALIAYLGGAFISFLVPLIIYFMKKDQSKFVAYHAMQALIFHIAMLVGYIIGGALTMVLIGFLLLPVVGILSLVYSIIAALAANKGEWYEIPVVGKYARQQAGV